MTQQNWFQPQQSDADRPSAERKARPGPDRERAARSPTPVFVAAALFVPAVIYSLLGCAVAWTGWTANDELGIALAVSLQGLVFASDPMAFLDTATLVTTVSTAVVLLLSLLLALRVKHVRPLLAMVAVSVTVYHAYSLGYLVLEGVADIGLIFVLLPALALVLWLVPCLLLLSPAVGRALRQR